MNKDTIERKLKAELVLFQMYVILLMGLVTGDINLFFKYVDNNDKFMLYLLITGIIFLVFIGYMIIKTYFTIKKLTKN
ncbi:MAG: hypothetical protein FVQ77_12560 [Cytophagales bacterium]|nr:hypothetical protein [Cytophagales bacterium]